MGDIHLQEKDGFYYFSCGAVAIPIPRPLHPGSFALVRFRACDI